MKDNLITVAGALGNTAQKIEDAREAATDGEIGALAGEFGDLDEKVGKLTVSFETMVKTVFDQFSSFEKDMRTINKTIDDLLYFQIDLNTTTADEQIKAATLNMIEYLSTLTPGSPAYEDAKAGILAIIDRFKTLGIDVSELVKALMAMDGMTVEIGLLYNLIEQSGDVQTEFHTGGLVKAHSGMWFPDERLARVKVGEYVLKAPTVERLGLPNVAALNLTANPNVLQSARNAGNRREPTPEKIVQTKYVIVNKPGPFTTIELADQIYPRILERDRKYVTSENPY